MRTLYLECYSGISGDMTVAALLDVGADQEKLLAALKSLPLDGYRVEITRTFKNGVAARDFHVILEDAHSHHVHRGLKEIFPIIDGSKMDPSAKLLAKEMFQRLAQAEGRVHGKAPEEVHFHEVGAVDAIVDIVETGSTLKENGLQVIEEITPISARLIVNTASMKLRKEEIEALLSQMEAALSKKGR